MALISAFEIGLRKGSKNLGSSNISNLVDIPGFCSSTAQIDKHLCARGTEFAERQAVNPGGLPQVTASSRNQCSPLSLVSNL